MNSPYTLGYTTLPAKVHDGGVATTKVKDIFECTLLPQNKAVSTSKSIFSSDTFGCDHLVLVKYFQILISGKGERECYWLDFISFPPPFLKPFPTSYTQNVTSMTPVFFNLIVFYRGCSYK